MIEDPEQLWAAMLHQVEYRRLPWRVRVSRFMDDKVLTSGAFAIVAGVCIIVLAVIAR